MDIVRSEDHLPSNYKPTEGLKAIAVAEGAEHHFRRAKDAAGLTAAVEAKLTEQRRFVLWWDQQEKAAGARGEAGPGRGHKTALTQANAVLALDSFGLDRITVHRWRSRLKQPADFAVAVERAKERCVAICERTPGDRRPRTEPSHLIKPSDNWNFNRPAYDRLPISAGEEYHEHGYIPGDLYANLLYYWTGPDDAVVAPMAGSGMIIKVYDDRRRWMGEGFWNLCLTVSDLVPRGEYIDQIEERNALEEICGPADLIVADLPYFGMCNGIYSDSQDDLGNMDWMSYGAAIGKFASNCAAVQANGQKAAIITAARFVDHEQRAVRLLDGLVEGAFCGVGYELIDKAFSTRRIQQTQTPTMALLNNRAREIKLMLSDMLVILVFQRSADAD